MLPSVVAPLGGQDEQGSPVRTAEHQRERCPALGQFDALQDLTALGDAHEREPRGNPDRAFGVQADAIRGDALRENAPAGQPAVGVDVEGGERPANDSEMISVRSSGVMIMPLGKWMSPATWRSWPSGVMSLM